MVVGEVIDAPLCIMHALLKHPLLRWAGVSTGSRQKTGSLHCSVSGCKAALSSTPALISQITLEINEFGMFASMVGMVTGQHVLYLYVAFC